MDDDKATTGSSTYHIDKLNENNYRSWAQQIRWILDERELLEVIEGKPTAPASTATEAENSAHETALAAWDKKAKKARSIIGSSITVSVMTYIEGIDNPVEMWKSFSDKYSSKTQTTLLQTVREFTLL